MPKKDKNRKNYQDGGDVNPLFTVKGSDLPPWETLSDTEKRLNRKDWFQKPLNHKQDLIDKFY